MILDIQWINVNPGKVFIGSDNRSILFGGIGPRHEVKIDYEFAISFLPIIREDASKFLSSNDYNIASESEWELSFQNNLISGNDEIEELSDRIRGSYWLKFCDGRPFLEDGWLMKSSRTWDSGIPLLVKQKRVRIWNMSDWLRGLKITLLVPILHDCQILQISLDYSSKNFL